jgi:hypothetical protein
VLGACTLAVAAGIAAWLLSFALLAIFRKKNNYNVQ